MSQNKQTNPLSSSTEKPGIHFHQVTDGKECVLVLEENINTETKVCIPNGEDNTQETPDGTKVVKLISEERFNRWWLEMKTWLNTHLDTTISNWITQNWSRVFQPKIDSTVDALDTSIINDPNNLYPNENYKHDSTQPEGHLVKLRTDLESTDTELQSSITEESKLREANDDTLKQNLNDHLPVGSLLHVFNSKKSHPNLEKWYVRCKGQEITEEEYPQLFNLMKETDPRNETRSASFALNTINVYPSIEDRQRTKREQLGHLLGKYLRSKLNGEPMIRFPYIFKGDTIVEMINDGLLYDTTETNPFTRYKKSNYPQGFKLKNLLTTNFRSTSFGCCSRVHNRSKPIAARGINGEQQYPYNTNIWVDGVLHDPSGDMAMNQIERTKHANFYNIQIHFRTVGRGENYVTLQILIGQSDSWTSVWPRDLELTCNVDLSSETGNDLLLYLELGNRNTNTINEDYGILIPQEFLLLGGYDRETDPNAMNEIYQGYNQMSKHYPLANGALGLYGLQHYADFSAKTSVIELVNIDNTENDWLYMRLGGLTQGRSSPLRSQSGFYYPSLHPIISYHDFDPPLSLYQLMRTNGRKYDWYCNFNYFRTGSNQSFFERGGYRGYINRFKIETNGFLKLVGLDDLYTTEQFKTFWDELIHSVTYKGWTDSESNHMTYPRLHGIDISTLPRCSSVNPPNFSTVIAFKGVNEAARGCIYGFRNEKNTLDPGYPIRGSRTVVHIPTANSIYFMVDNNANNRSRRKNNHGFIIHTNGTWKDLSYYLKKVDSNKKEYIENTLPDIVPTGYNPIEEFVWSDRVDEIQRSYQSAGLCRIRIYEEGSHTPWVDLIYVDFASNKTWEDGLGGEAGDTDGIGHGFRILNLDAYIIEDLRRPGGMDSNIVLVIDRITNLGNTITPDRDEQGLIDDCWNVFNFSWFIDYCNNGNRLLTDRQVRVPDLSLEEEITVKNKNLKSKQSTEYWIKYQ